MASRPTFVNELLARPLPPLHPRKLTDTRNEPFSSDIRSRIADAQLHPLLESVLHLLNEDLFSAHFLLRKMQKDDWGRYLHGLLHLAEGDYGNIKAWLRDTPEPILSLHHGSADPRRKAIAHVDRVALLSGKTLADCEETTKQAGVEEWADSPSADGLDEVKERRACWDELKSCLAELERMHGWGQVDGTQAYTKDEGKMAEMKRGMIGEGWRSF